jgi:ribonuclease Z
MVRGLRDFLPRGDVVDLAMAAVAGAASGGVVSASRSRPGDRDDRRPACGRSVRSIGPMDLSIFFAGTAGSLPTPRRGLPATLLRRGGDKILFDCGEGTQRQLLRSVGLPEITEVFLTHHHLDHWLGLPGMLKSFELRDRTTPLTLFGPPGTEALMRGLHGVVGRLRYPFRVTDLEPDAIVEFDGYEVHALRVRHRGEAYGYAIIEDDRPGRFDAELAAALGVAPGPDFGRLQRGEPVGGVAPAQVMGAARAGRRVVLSGDTSPCDMVRVAADGADLLVHEATFANDERDRAMQTGHSTARQAAELAHEAGVRLLALTHLSTRYGGREIRDEARAIFPAVEVPRDFDLIDIPFPEKGGPAVHRWEGARNGLPPERLEPAVGPG